MDNDPFGLKQNKLLGIFFLFIAGLGLAFTPCVLPMIPIVANIVANEHKHSAKHGFLLTSCYGMGVATAYGLLGVVVSLVGQQYITHYMQNPLVLISFAVLFMVLGLHLLGVFSIRLPFALTQWFQRVSRIGEHRLGGYMGSAVAGFFSAIVVSPCVTGPLIGALTGVASVGDPVFGYFALFALGFGLSVPLIILGTTEGKFLPEAGAWMNWIKHGFALMLFGIAIMLLERIYDSSVMLILWGVLSAAVAYWCWQWKGKGKRITQFVTVLVAIWAVLQLLGAALGNTNPIRPLENVTKPVSVAPVAIDPESAQPVNQMPVNTTAVKKIYTLAELETLVASEPKLIVDVWASWCIECKHMEVDLFKTPPYDMAAWRLVKLDITKVTDDSKAVMAALNIFGPPALVLYQDGKMVALRQGVTKRAEFKEILRTLNQQGS